MPTSPIRRHVGQIFIPVRDLRRSASWYAAVLGFDPPAPSHDDTILDIPVQEGPRIALDANRPDFSTDGPPRLFFWTDDMAATMAHLKDLGVELRSAVEDIGSVRFVQFADPDGTPLMVAQRTEAAGT